MSFLDQYANGLALRTMADQDKIRNRNYNATADLLGNKLIGDVNDLYYGNKLVATILTQLDNAARGMSGDAGEVSTCIQRTLEYGKPLDKDNLLVECGDVLWRIVQICDAMGWTLEDVARANLAKLAVRYPKEYSDHLAAEENRNRDAEDAAAKQASMVRQPGTQMLVPGPSAQTREQTGQGWAEPPHVEEKTKSVPACEADRLVAEKQIANENYNGVCSKCGRPIHKSNSTGVCTSCHVSPIKR